MVALSMALGGCFQDPGDFVFGFQTTGLTYEFFDEDEGVFPSDITLINPNNPFRNNPPGAVTKFSILANGGAVASYYAFATLLATETTGEHQFFTAQSAQRVVESGSLDLATENELREIAIRGYQSMLLNFPDTRTFAANGIDSFELATLAVLGIVDLGGRIPGDWVLVDAPSNLPNGFDLDGDGDDDITAPPGLVAVRQAGSDLPPPDPADPPDEVPTPGFGDEENP
ncbi:MAG: hypothetical protein AAGH15_06065 [Myxococcota bacterium]